MNNLQTLLTAYAAGDFDTVLKGTPWIAANRVYSMLEEEGNQGFRSLFKTAMKEAATAHVLTLLVEDMAGCMTGLSSALGQTLTGSDEAWDSAVTSFTNHCHEVLALVAMLKGGGHATQS